MRVEMLLYSGVYLDDLTTYSCFFLLIYFVALAHITYPENPSLNRRNTSN